MCNCNQSDFTGTDLSSPVPPNRVIQWRRYNFHEGGGRKLGIKILIPKKFCGSRVVLTMYEISFIIYAELLL